MEEAKRKKAQRKARRAERWHVKEIKNFFTKVFSPLIKLSNAAKERRKQKEEGGL